MTPTLLGIPAQLITKPLTEALKRNDSFQLVVDSRPNIARQLRGQELSAALLSPLDYAKDSSDYCIVPNVAVVSETSNGSIVVRLREGVQEIKTLAVDPAYASEIVLTKIILSEQFDIQPALIPMNAPVETMLTKADAALLVGEAAFHVLEPSDKTIDIVEEWNEMTDLPFVHAIWCGRENDLTKAEINQIQQAAIKGVAGIGDISMELSPEKREALGKQLISFSYELTDDARQGLAEFMKYLFYHGILPDVAELTFYNTQEDKDLPSGVSPN